MQEYTLRRNKLINSLMDHSVAIIPASRLQYRNNKTEYAFRQNSNFYYLTGLIEPKALCVLLKGNGNDDSKFILLVEPKDKDAETWIGTREGETNAKTIYHADEAYSIDRAAEIIPQLLKNKQAIYYPVGEDWAFDKKIMAWLQLARGKITSRARRSGENILHIPNSLHDVAPLISELRLFKTAQEISAIRTAAKISSQGHLQLMQVCKPGLHEYQLEASFTAHCLQHGCRALAYPMIVAGGDNACILHYGKNDQQLEAGRLVVIDAGGEYQNYAADITRTLPIGGKFSEPHKILYNLVLQAQLAGLKEIKPGNKFYKVQEVVVKTLVTGLVANGVLTGDIDNLIEAQAYKKFYMHNASHWLGLDVHDVGDYYTAGKHRPFEPGMVLTIEPGLYIAHDALDVALQWRGIGIRIEDMVLVTEQGNEVLSKDVPKAIEDIEATMSPKISLKVR